MSVYTVTSDFTVYGGETISGTDQSLLYVSGRAVSMQIDGTLSQTVTAAAIYGMPAIWFDTYPVNGKTVTISSTGVIRVTSAGYGSGVVGSWAPGLINRGLVDVHGVTGATGISITAYDGSFDNGGVIRATADHGALGAGYDGERNFTNSGTVEAAGGDGATTGIVISRLKGDFLNTGTVRAVDTTSSRESVAVSVTGYYQPGMVTNQGTLEGDVALRLNYGGGAERIINWGSMLGKVDLAGTTCNFTNNGRVTGTITLSQGNDVYDGRFGTFTSTLMAGLGDDSVMGGDQAEVFFGGAGADTIDGAAGDDTISGGLGADRLDGALGIDTLSFADAPGAVAVDLRLGVSWLSEGQDSISNFERVIGGVWGDTLRGSLGGATMSGGYGHDTLEGRGGDDLLSGDGGADSIFGDNGFDRLLGGAGDDILAGGMRDDKLTGGAGADVFLIESGSDLDRIPDFNYAEGDRILGGLNVVFTASQQGADTVLETTSAAKVVLVGVQLSSLPADFIIRSLGERPISPLTYLAGSTVTLTSQPYVLPEGEAVRFTNQNGLAYGGLGTTLDVVIAGALRVAATSDVPAVGPALSAFGYDGTNSADGTVHIVSGGRITVDATAGMRTAYGLALTGTAPRLVNEGLIEVLGRSDAMGVLYGFHSNYVEAAVINDGTIRVQTEGRGTGVYMGSGLIMTNSGLIDVSGGQSAEGVRFTQGDAGFFNTGTIRAVDQNPLTDSVAVYFNSYVWQFPFVNAGVLQGDYALKVVNPSGTQFESDAIFGGMTFTNTGQMIGKVDMGPQRQVLVNSGAITGDVNLGSASDVYDGRLGSVVGLVSGGDGMDSLNGGSQFDYLQGNAGNDTILGGAGGDWLLGGRDNDILNGESGDDQLYGNLGNDWCDAGDGADTVRGGQGNDVVLGGTGNDWLSGDRGDDTLVGGGGADTFHGSQDAGLDRVNDFNAGEGDRVLLDPGTTYTLRQVGADTVIDMGGGNQMVLVGVQLSSLPAGWIV